MRLKKPTQVLGIFLLQVGIKPHMGKVYLGIKTCQRLFGGITVNYCNIIRYDDFMTIKTYLKTQIKTHYPIIYIEIYPI